MHYLISILALLFSTTTLAGTVHSLRTDSNGNITASVKGGGTVKVSTTVPLGMGFAFVNMSGTCTTSPCGVVISGGNPEIESVTRPQAGVYNINFATPWEGSTRFACVVNDQFGGGGFCESSTGNNASSWIIVCRNSGTLTDSRFTAVCTGILP